jgi:hypothetical protein
LVQNCARDRSTCGAAWPSVGVGGRPGGSCGGGPDRGVAGTLRERSDAWRGRSGRLTAIKNFNADAGRLTQMHADKN